MHVSPSQLATVNSVLHGTNHLIALSKSKNICIINKTNTSYLKARVTATMDPIGGEK
jgi:hypothetical protein